MAQDLNFIITLVVTLDQLLSLALRVRVATGLMFKFAGCTVSFTVCLSNYNRVISRSLIPAKQRKSLIFAFRI